MTDAPKYEVKIYCGCGGVHTSLKDWQECPAALTAKQLMPWWWNGGPVKHVEKEDKK